MSKVNTEKSDVKKEDNGKSFVKNRAGFHPAEQDLDEKASLDAYEQKQNAKKPAAKKDR